MLPSAVRDTAGEVGRRRGAKPVARSGPAQMQPQSTRQAELIVCDKAIERSFAWAARFRRLARDYERLPQTVAGLHFVAFVTLMLAKATAVFDLVRNTV
jgi:transposase